MTVSIGLTSYVPGETDRDMVASADQALYLAKQAGRNRVIAIPLQVEGQAPGQAPAPAPKAEGGGGTPPPAAG